MGRFGSGGHGGVAGWWRRRESYSSSSGSGRQRQQRQAVGAGAAAAATAAAGSGSSSSGRHPCPLLARAGPWSPGACSQHADCPQDSWQLAGSSSCSWQTPSCLGLRTVKIFAGAGTVRHSRRVRHANPVPTQVWVSVLPFTSPHSVQSLTPRLVCPCPLPPCACVLACRTWCGGLAAPSWGLSSLTSCL